jgi:hypothetical protein
MSTDRRRDHECASAGAMRTAPIGGFGRDEAGFPPYISAANTRM